MGKKGYRDLLAWQRAKDLAVRVYRLTEDGPIRRDLWLRNQIRRSGVSIASNLAEGDERGTDKEAIRFFRIAEGSLAELQTQMQIAWEVGFLDKPVYESLEKDCAELAKIIGGLIRARA